ncbi:MAG: M23 family metallopeptidase [Acidimicrobiia bacterium]|nr:M23 family metallopeptidase [Acidimicrobiia bacterium]
MPFSSFPWHAPHRRTRGTTGGDQPPVSAPVADPFRPPSTPYGPGNRGIDYATAPGTEVRAAADGEVVFAGQVGGTLHVVLFHGDGIRTSYSFLASTRVQRGDTVHQGQVLGATSAQPFHFGARAGDAYVDPALLFTTGPPRVRLVPDSERRPQSESRERSGLLDSLVGLGGKVVDAAGAGADAVQWAAGKTADAGAWVTRTPSTPSATRRWQGSTSSAPWSTTASRSFRRSRRITSSRPWRRSSARATAPPPTSIRGLSRVTSRCSSADWARAHDARPARPQAVVGAVRAAVIQDGPAGPTAGGQYAVPLYNGKLLVAAAGRSSMVEAPGGLANGVAIGPGRRAAGVHRSGARRRARRLRPALIR